MKSTFTLTLLLLAVGVWAQSFRSFDESDGLPSQNVLCSTSDRNGTMWFGTQRGIAIYDGSDWETMSTTSHPGLANNNVSSLLVATDGSVWAGTDFGISFYDGTTWTTFTTTDGLGSNRITNIAEVSNGDIWISDFNGATRYDGTEFVSFSSADGLPFGGVEDILEASNGNIIMATGLGGVAIFDGTDFTIVDENDGLVINSTTCLTKDAQDNIWVGTASGISVFSDELVWKENHTRMYILPPPDTLNPVVDIAINSLGEIWTGIYVDYLVSVGGVASYDQNSWTDYDVEDGLIGPTITSVTIDEDDEVWITTSSGITRIGKEGASVASLALKNMNAYPNPTRGNLTIQIPAEDFGKELSILNTFGQQVYSDASVGLSDYNLDLNGYSKGAYTIIIGDKRTRVVLL